MITIREQGRQGIVAEIDALEHALQSLAPALLAATDQIYEHARQNFETRGDGGWPQLADATIQRKAAQGYAEPDRPLYAEGNLFESATSPAGKYSLRYVSDHQAVVGVDWSENGVQIPPVLSAGNIAEGGNIPARPIYTVDEQLVAQLAQVLMTTVVHEAALA